jgi:hypothetical protein
MSRKNPVAQAVEATAPAFPTVAPVAVVSPFTYSVTYTDDKGKPQTLTKTLDQETDDALALIVTHATAADDTVTDKFEQIVAACFPAGFAATVGESVADLRARMFKLPEYEFMYGVMQQKHRKYAPYLEQMAIAKKEGEKTSAGEVALAAAKGLIESARSTAGHQARNIVRKWAAKFGVSVDGGDKQSQSARGQIEEFIGELNAKLEKPRGDEKLEGERKMRRECVEMLRAFLSNTHGTAANPFGIAFDKPAPAREIPATAPVVTLTKAQIAELTK